MESNWRWNAIRWFYNDLDVALAARSVESLFPPFETYVIRLRRFPFRVFGIRNADGSIGSQTFIGGPVNTFPFGIAVEPDE